MGTNESDKRQFSDDKLYQFLFEYLKTNREIKFEYIQNQMINQKMLEENHEYYSTRPRFLHNSDYKKILEFYWELTRKNIIIPVQNDGYGDFDIPFQYRITEKGQKFFQHDLPLPYTDFIANQDEYVEDPNLITHHRERIHEMISFYQIIKKEIENQPNLKEDDIQFLLKEYFHKEWSDNK